MQFIAYYHFGVIVLDVHEFGHFYFAKIRAS